MSEVLLQINQKNDDESYAETVRDTILITHANPEDGHPESQ